MKKLLIVMGMLGLFVGMSAPCLAEGVNYGCLDKEDKFRIVGDPKECKEGERVIFWTKIMPVMDLGLKTMPSAGDTAGGVIKKIPKVPEADPPSVTIPEAESGKGMKLDLWSKEKEKKDDLPKVPETGPPSVTIPLKKK